MTQSQMIFQDLPEPKETIGKPSPIRRHRGRFRLSSNRPLLQSTRLDSGAHENHRGRFYLTYYLNRAIQRTGKRRIIIP